MAKPIRKKNKLSLSWEDYCLIDKPNVGYVAICRDANRVSSGYCLPQGQLKKPVSGFSFYGNNKSANLYFITELKYLGHSYVDFSIIGGEKHYLMQETKAKNRHPDWLFLPVNQLLVGKEFFLAGPSMYDYDKCKKNVWGFIDVYIVIKNNANKTGQLFVQYANYDSFITWDSVAALINVCGGKVVQKPGKNTVIVYGSLHNATEIGKKNSARLHNIMSQLPNKKFEVKGLFAYIKQQLKKQKSV